MSNITKVKLLKTNMDSDYQHTLCFANLSDQLAYFNSLPKIEYDDFSYQRKDSFIRVGSMYDDVLPYNYVMYQNTNYSNKWFFAFITDIKFFSEGKTEIYIETDVMQTWMFDIEIKKSFVEREHCSYDGIGYNTQPENVQLGEYICNEMIQDEKLELSDHVIFGSTITPGELANIGGGKYGGVYSGVRYYLAPTNSEDANYVAKTLQMFADSGKIDAVSSLFTIPKFIKELAMAESSSYYIKDNNVPYSYNFNLNKNYGFEGYVPKNNKLKSFPYTYLLVSNGNGGVAEYKYEHFGVNSNETDINFMVYGVITPGCSIRLIPAIYKGVQLPESEGLNLGKYPQCNWATDQFTNWLTQNGVNVVTSVVNAGVGTIAGSIVGGPVGTATGIVSGISGVASSINEVVKASRVPPQTQGNINCGDVNAAMGNTTFTYYAMSIRKEYAEIIDRYFDLYGYKTNKLKVPYKWHRKAWWYTKTINANIVGNIPENDLKKIKDNYNNGITFWRSEFFKNYDADNSIS